jgi:hypothetical protein
MATALLPPYDPAEQTPELSLQRKRIFLEAYQKNGVLKYACAAANVHRQTYYDWLRDDPTFATAAREAREVAIEALEEEAHRRAIEGVEDPIYYKGEFVATVRKPSDTLMIFLLKANRPEKYRERVELSGPNGAPLESVTNVQINVIGADASDVAELPLPIGATPVSARPETATLQLDMGEDE